MARRTLGLVAPSGFLPDVAVIDRAAALFSGRGWQVTAGDSVFAREQRFAGPDELRLADLMRFATDDSVDVVLAARGGYGMSRLLGGIDYAAIRRRAPIIAGYSDFTAFSLAYLARAGGVSLSGPSAGDFGAAVPEPFTVEHFFGLIENRSYSIDLPLEGRAGEHRGRLWGGNLAMIGALMGTPFMPRIRAGLLVVEDVNEPAYKLERLLYQLAQAGILQRQAAIVLGDFDPVTPMPNDQGFGLDAVVSRLREIAGVPVVRGLPFGHGSRKLTLPIGGRARLVIRRGGRATLELSGYPSLARRQTGA
ncbi:MAG: LD-carboxypeptidase [Burkholderiaceae bacterium]|nr:LD-carboxypeptidase [Burkholderiaceae bacterium]